MKITDGMGLVGIGVFHELVGLIAGAQVSVDIVRDGLVNAIGEDWQRQTLLWFHVTGIAVIVLGEALRTLERLTGRVPARFGWMTLGIGVFGVVLLPMSGFWLVLVWGFAMIVRGRRAQDSNPAAS